MLPRRSSRLVDLHNRKLPSLLINLHPEIWRLILKKLKQEEALNLRLVDKNLKMKVDNLYEDWVIRVNENCPYLEMILALRIKKIRIDQFLKPVPSRPPGVICKYPDLITELSIDYNFISCENLNILIQCKNLKDITIAFYSKSNDVFWQTLDPQDGFNFPQLQSLLIELPREPEQLLDGNFYERFMTLSVMPKLQKLEVKWNPSGDASQTSVYRYASTLLNFMSRHGQTIKHFTYNSYNLYERPYTLTLLDQEALLRNFSTLETLKIDSDFDSSDVLHDYWEELIKIQSKLNEIVLKYNNSKFINSNQFCTKICAQNHKTLTKVHIQGLALEAGETIFDISIFSKCVNLRDLTLSRSRKEAKKTELLNLHTLPQLIGTIELKGFLILSEDLSGFLKQCESLYDINIERAGWTLNLGVNFKVLEIILKHPSLTYVSFDPYSINKPKRNLAKMNEIYSRLVSGNVTNFFEKRPNLRLLKSFELRALDPDFTQIWVNFDK